MTQYIVINKLIFIIIVYLLSSSINTVVVIASVSSVSVVSSSFTQRPFLLSFIKTTNSSLQQRNKQQYQQQIPRLYNNNNNNKKYNRIMSLRPTKQSTSFQQQQHHEQKQQQPHTTTKLSSSIISSSITSPSILYNTQSFYTSTIIIIIINSLGCIINLMYPKLHYHIDLFGTGAFAISTIPTLLLSTYTTKNIRIQISCYCVMLWSIKLALFLLYRVIQIQHDQRLTNVLSSKSSTIGFWFVSMIWGILCSLPHTIGTISTNVIGPKSFLYIGSIVFMIGWCIETIADYQKWIFKQQYDTKQFCNIGLWSISQHPNWFGNILLWIGIFLINSYTYIEPIISLSITNTNKKSIISKCVSYLWSYHRFILASIGPIFMYLLFYSQATGYILNDTMKSNLIKYGYNTNEIYTKYINDTPLIIPNLSKLIVQWIRSSGESK